MAYFFCPPCFQRLKRPDKPITDMLCPKCARRFNGPVGDSTKLPVDKPDMPLEKK
jgi:hypothetical protein